MPKQLFKIIPVIVLICSFLVALNISASLKEKPLINLGYPINTTGDDFSPSITADGKTMVFNSRERSEHNHNIYIMHFKNGRWTKPIPIKEINSQYNDETPFISTDGSVLVFSSDREGSIRPSITSDKKVRITYDIFISRSRKGKWTRPVRVPGTINTGNNERSPSISHDKKHLYFTRFPFRGLKYLPFLYEI